MGGAFSQLCVLLAQHKCKPSAVASLLTFVPPEPPYYELRPKGEGSTELNWLLDPEVVRSAFPDVAVNVMKTEKGSFIPGFLFRHPEAKLTILFSHGNAADCGTMRENYIQMVRRLRVNVFAYDYTGYGAAFNEDMPSEAHTYSDIRAAYDYLVEAKICPKPGEQVVLYGQSVGSGPSCKLAADPSRPVRGLVLHSPIMSGVRVLLENRGPLCCCDIYPNINRIERVTAPVFIIHGDQDEEVAFRHGERLQAKVPNSCKREPCWIRGAGHNDIVEDFPNQYYPPLERFVRSLERHVAEGVTEFTPSPTPGAAAAPGVAAPGAPAPTPTSHGATGAAAAAAATPSSEAATDSDTQLVLQ
ncbi:Alpha/beta hydrolase domain-containing protein 17C (Abhydrolase domain-containing protein 17C) [Durusdinium trenchii]|uniref:Alpha/beta hydrolase domain-containing protein 17C (Abhydrolase domain-containing protein 17C) n=1 Tax=Durusdinium trenchii TaxID=1381693 RepID=A0ABP0N6B5_9DINO